MRTRALSLLVLLVVAVAALSAAQLFAGEAPPKPDPLLVLRPDFDLSERVLAPHLRHPLAQPFGKAACSA